ncbi:MAG: hypothetical protein OXC27_10270 [Caldilineaceae bacterium]|nr:hypothetical protein [Caldilineaceae bacterium]
MNELRSLDSQSFRITGLALLTALIHLFLGVQGGIFIFILNGLGFIALVVGLYLLPQLANWRTHIRWALVAYTAVTIIAYFVVNQNALDSGIGLLTKAVEVILIVLLYLQTR